MFQRPSKFVIVLMSIAVIASLYVAFGPLLREVVARHTWQQIPCHLYSTGGFLFEYKGVRYKCGRPNLWEYVNADAFAVEKNTPFPEINGTCFVNGGNPPVAVLRLDAYRHLEAGVGHYVSASLLLAAAVVFAIMDYVRRRSRRPSRPMHQP